ncbi:tetratricopeptide repeat protein 27 [Elysia marginata]|uniref:Tetratricopeptide repeat protein 27 n=1 Tax=Elysia marginata TaxID=1093978 RepID=A0AAV4HHM2_9GAST|nr:tetratricopeptide repeat protein 27 [Elysia marginata]
MAALIRKCESILLTCDKQICEIKETDFPEVLSKFLEGKYEVILESSQVSNQILGSCENERSAKDLGVFLQQNLDTLLSLQCDDPELRDLTILIVAASCLQLFVQNNWLGPPTVKDPLQFCNKNLDEQKVNQEASSELSMDGETLYTKTRFILFLYIARVILLDYRDRFKHLQSWDWWLMRCLVLQQAVLTDKSPTLKATITELIDELSQKEPLMNDEENRLIQVIFHVEAGYAFQYYYEYKRAAEQFETAKKQAGIIPELTGAMGKRTRFQQDEKAQLVLVVKREKERSDVLEEDPEPELPKILALDDDTVLNEVAYTNIDMDAESKITSYEQVLILGLMESYRRSRAEERLTTEEVLTYIAYILKHVTNWSVAVTASNLRSKLEKDSRRRVERSMLQLEELANRASKPEASPGISSRIPLFYAVNVPTVWTIQRDLASLLLSLGLTGEALDVFEKLEMWEDAIACYQRMGKLEKAEFVIRQRLAVEETPALLCFLGDVTRNIEHYQRAWELSNHRNARAMRCMGYIYFQEKNFEKALECFSASLEKNSLQVPVWFTYGCAAMACQKFDLGVKGFRKCVVIDYDNFEAWANLATCYTRLKEKHKAFSTLQDAIKCNYENWRLWENSLIIGTDCGEFEHVIRSYHRLLDLKEKYNDAEILGILTRAVIEKIPDVRGISAERLWGKLTELFGRVTSQVTSDGDVWASYAKLYSHQIGDKEPDMEKAVTFQQKALRCFTQKADWEKDKDVCKNVAEKTINLIETQIQLCADKTAQETLKILPASKLMLRGTLVKIQKQYTDPITQELDPDVSEMCEALDSALSNLVAKIDAAKAGV